MKKFDEVALELEELSSEGLSAVSKLALKMRQAQEKLLLAEELVKNWKAIFREISEEQLPEAMAERPPSMIISARATMS